MTPEENLNKVSTANTISDETGQLDARFMLWRTFCAENNILVDTLPSELTGDVKTKWEELKGKQLNVKT